MTPPTIRRATLDDIDLVAPLFDAYRGFYGQPSDPDAARAFLRERIARDESVVLIAIDEARAVGFVQFYPMFSSVRMRRVWLLNDLYVDAGARRSGAGRALLVGASDEARRNGVTRLVLETGVDNAPARALYRAAGWGEDATQWYSLDL